MLVQVPGDFGITPMEIVIKPPNFSQLQKRNPTLVMLLNLCKNDDYINIPFDDKSKWYTVTYDNNLLENNLRMCKMIFNQFMDL